MHGDNKFGENGYRISLKIITLKSHNFMRNRSFKTFSVSCKFQRSRSKK